MPTSLSKWWGSFREMMITKRQSRRQMFCDAGITLGILAVAAAVCTLLTHMGDSDSAVPMVFMLAVLLVARLTDGFLFSLVATVVSVIGVNYAFTYPYFAFNFTITGYPLTFVTMFAVSIVVGMLTDQVKRQERVKSEAEKEKMKANLLRSVSHDLRTPLTSISGNADVLLDQGSTGTAVLDSQTRRGMLLSIRSDAQWLNATVENLLAITKLEGGGMRLSTTLELMDDIVEEALRHVNPAVREHDLKVVACDEPALVNVDARLMVQLVVNLVNNAITYTPAGSHIVISIGVDDGRVACSVADDGPGIAPEDRERIFESFYTANHGLADSHRSVGLGLSLCRSIALAHGGSIEVAAADPHGSVFTIELPAADVSFDKE